MTTLAQYRREMHLRSRHETGRTYPIASLTTTTVVVSALATGTVGPAKFANKWLIRAEAANPPADRVRITTDTGYASSTGTLTHAGTNYADTTATSENVEICEYEPILMDDMVQETLQSLPRDDREIFPTRQGVNKFWLSDLTWVTEPRDILRVMLKKTPVLSRNRFFEKWNSVSTTGALLADWWTLAGTSATYARSTTQVRTGLYSAAITRSGTDCTLTQSVGTLDTGVVATGSAGSLRSQVVTAVAVVWSAVASQVRVKFDDGVTVSTSSYHTGGSGWEEVSVTATLSSVATKADVIVSVEGSNTVCYVDDAYLVYGNTNDSVRRDDYPEQEITDQISYDQGAGTLAMNTPAYGWAAQLVVYTMRPYSGFDATRLTGGLADADVQDAPLTTVACGALWRLYDGIPGKEAEAGRWRMEYESLAAPQLDDEGDGRPGLPLPPMVMAGGRRF